MINKASYQLWSYVALRAKGKTPLEAARQIMPAGSARQNISAKADTMEANPDVQTLLALFLEVDGMSPDDMRREIVVAMLDDSRNPELPIGARQKAREWLIKMFGLDTLNVQNDPDDEFRKFLMGKSKGECASPRVSR